MGGDARAVGSEQIEHLRQVQLPLSVLGAQPWQRLLEWRGGEGEDARVHLADLALSLGCIALLLGLDHALDRYRSASRTTRP